MKNAMSKQKPTFESQVFPPVIGIVVFIVMFVVPVIMQSTIQDNRTIAQRTETLQATVDSLKNVTERKDSIEVRYDSLEYAARTFHPDVIWTARTLISESNQPHEFETLAWVIRNRVDLGYNDKHTYRDVVLDPKQFSAFNYGSRRRMYYATKSWYDQFESGYGTTQWKKALETARKVVFADSSERPFTIYGLYFYSEISMPKDRHGNSTHPSWAEKFDELPMHHLEDERFRVYADFNHTPSTPPPGLHLAYKENTSLRNHVASSTAR